MASFKRSMLEAYGIEADKISAIMEAHVEVVDALKKERDGYKEQVEELAGTQKKLEELQAKMDKGDDYKKKFEDLVAENAAKDAAKVKTEAYRKMAKDAGIADKYLDTVIRASKSEIEKLEMDGDKVKDAESITGSMKTTWVDFIPVSRTDSKDPATPPANMGGRMTKEEIMAIKDRDERRAKIAENMDLFEK